MRYKFNFDNVNFMSNYAHNKDVVKSTKKGENMFGRKHKTTNESNCGKGGCGCGKGGCGSTKDCHNTNTNLEACSAKSTKSCGTRSTKACSNSAKGTSTNHTSKTTSACHTKTTRAEK